MFNPEKQSRVNGKFGGKVVAAVEAEAERVENEAVEVVTKSYKTINDAINHVKAGDIIVIEHEVTNKGTGYILLVILICALMVGFSFFHG